MTREEFESILEEAFLEGYNNAIDEIEEILDEDYIDIEDDYEVYDEDAHPRSKRFLDDFGRVKGMRSKKIEDRLKHDLRKAGLQVNGNTNIKNFINELNKNKKANDIYADYLKKEFNRRQSDNYQKARRKFEDIKSDKIKNNTIKNIKNRIAVNYFKQKL